MPTKATQNSMSEGLQKLLGDIAQMQAFPDADMDFLTQLQQMVVGKIRSSIPGPGQPGQQPGAPGQPPGMPGAPTNSPLPPASSPGPPGGMGGGMGGLSVTGGPEAAPNMDELSRMLGSTQQAG